MLKNIGNHVIENLERYIVGVLIVGGMIVSKDQFYTPKYKVNIVTEFDINEDGIDDVIVNLEEGQIGLIRTEKDYEKIHLIRTEKDYEICIISCQDGMPIYTTKDSIFSPFGHHARK